MSFPLLSFENVKIAAYTKNSYRAGSAPLWLAVVPTMKGRLGCLLENHMGNMFLVLMFAALRKIIMSLHHLEDVDISAS